MDAPGQDVLRLSVIAVLELAIRATVDQIVVGPGDCCPRETIKAYSEPWPSSYFCAINMYGHNGDLIVFSCHLIMRQQKALGFNL